MNTRTILSLAVVVLGACAGPQAEQAIRAQQTLVGLSKGELLACAGVPQRTAAGPDGTEYLSYGRASTTVYQDLDYEDFGWIPGRRILRPEVSTWTTNHRCEATFAVRDGRVTELRYNDNRDIQLCHQIVGSCLPALSR